MPYSRWAAVCAVCVLLLGGCAGRFAAPQGLPPIHTDVVQTGKPPLNWERFVPNDAGTYVAGMITGPDGALWFTDVDLGGIFRIDMQGKIAFYPLQYARNGRTQTFHPEYMTLGADGKFYMDEPNGFSIGVFAPPNHLTVYSLKDETEASGLARGPDGNVWFYTLGYLARITPQGAIAYYKYPSGITSNIWAGIGTGPDGKVWFGESELGIVADIDPNTSKITEYSLPNQNINCYYPQGLAVGGDGNIYVGCTHSLVRVTTTGVAHEIPYYPGTYTSPEALITGSDGDIYFSTFVDKPILGHLDVESGVPGGITIPFNGPGLLTLASGSDGNAWTVDGQGYVDVYILKVLNVTPASLTLQPQAHATLTATYNNAAPLSAKSADTGIATVSKVQNQKKFIVTAVAKGSTTITVRDPIGNSFNVPVIVK